MLNKSLQVRRITSNIEYDGLTHIPADQCPEHERGACGPDVQELPIERLIPPRRFDAIPFAYQGRLTHPLPVATDNLESPS